MNPQSPRRPWGTEDVDVQQRFTTKKWVTNNKNVRLKVVAGGALRKLDYPAQYAVSGAWAFTGAVGDCVDDELAVLPPPPGWQKKYSIESSIRNSPITM